jgi:hypothetical protein
VGERSCNETTVKLVYKENVIGKANEENNTTFEKTN